VFERQVSEGDRWQPTAIMEELKEKTRKNLSKSGPVLHGWLIPILLSITVPVTTLLLARTSLFRKRMAGENVPAEVSSRRTDSGS
jgi:H+/gluconate symporter-like permease